MSRLIDRERNKNEFEKCYKQELDYVEEDVKEIIVLKKKLDEYDKKGIFIPIDQCHLCNEDLGILVKKKINKRGDK